MLCIIEYNSFDQLLFILKPIDKFEASNKVLLGTSEKMQEENPKDWHMILSETFWAYKTSKRSSIGVSPFSLTYGQDAIHPMDVVVPSLRVSRENGLTFQE